MAEIIGRCLGLEKNKGNKMTQWVLKINGQVLPQISLRRMQPDELSCEVEISK